MKDILVIDDDTVVLTIVESMLLDRGYTVRTAENGASGLIEVLRRVPDLIILDLSMPGIDGLALARGLRESETTRRIPLVALTGDGSQTTDRAALESGCYGFLGKRHGAGALCDGRGHAGLWHRRGLTRQRRPGARGARPLTDRPNI